MLPPFTSSSTVLNFKWKRRPQTAQAWYVCDKKVFVNWCGEPTAVALDKPPQSELDAVLFEHAEVTQRPHSQAHWFLAGQGYLQIKHGKFGQASEITPEGRRYLDRMSRRGGGATSQVVPAPVKKPDSNSSPEATTGPAKSRALPRGAAPRPRRVAAKEAGQTPDYVDITANSPPAVPLKAGAPNDDTTAPLRGKAPRQTAHTRRETNNKSRRTSGPTPNAVRVTTGSKVTYYPLSMYEVVHGSKHRVRTLNKTYRAYPVAASISDVEIR